MEEPWLQLGRYKLSLAFHTPPQMCKNSAWNFGHIFSKHFTVAFLHLVLLTGTPELARPLPTPLKWGKPQQPVQTPRQRAALTLSRVISGRLGVMSLLSLSCSEMGSDAS